MKIQLDMYQTIAVAVVVLMLGKFLKERVELLERFCIPAPVIGGVIFAIFTCLCYVTGIAEFSFDGCHFAIACRTRSDQTSPSAFIQRGESCG